LENTSLLLWPELVSTAALYRYFELRLRNRCPSSQVAITTLKKKYLKGEASEVYAMYDIPEADDLTVPPDWRRDLGHRQRSIKLPPLEGCRDMFSAYIGQPIDWGSDETIPSTTTKPARPRY
jgi:hypothetical protein